MRETREVRAVEPLMETMDEELDGLGVSDAMSGILENGRLTVESLAETGRIPVEDDIFLVAHEMSAPTPPHRHDFVEMVYVLKGRVINRVDGKELYLPQGVMCLMGRDSEHMLDVDDPEAVVCNVCMRDGLLAQPSFVRFLEGDNLVGRFVRGETGGSYLVLTDIDNRAIKMSMSALINAYAANGYRESFDVEARTMLLLVALSNARTYTSHGADAHVMEMLDYAEEHASTITVGELARTFGYNESYLSQYIKRATGKRASQFIIDAKLKHACELLKEGDMPSERIAHEVGYKSYSRFHQVFKERFGVTPREWREGSRYE